MVFYKKSETKTTSDTMFGGWDFDVSGVVLNSADENGDI